MTASIENIVQHLFHQPSLQTVSVDELQQMTQEFPSFAAARFLLLKKMQETGHPDFNSQLHKTTVYFNNPLWLQLLLSPMKEEAGAWRPSNGAATEMIEHDFDLLDEPSADLPAEASAPAEALPQTDFVPDASVQENEPAELPVHTVSTETPVHTDEPSLTETPAVETSAKPDESLVIKQIDEPLIEEVLARLRGQINDAGDITSIDNIQAEEPLVQEVLNRLRGQINEAGYIPPIDRTARIEDPLVQEVLDRLRSQIHQADVQQQPEAETPAPEAPTIYNFVPAEIATQEDQPAADDFAPFPDSSAEVSAKVETPAQTDAPAEAPARADSPKIIIETPMAQHDVLFEPYHTIDYFASQGIRLDKLEPNPKDRLGRQLKSFTEWLKSMKKLPQASIEKVLAENEESAVVAAASHSVEGKDVITEAMAEVFEKQGLNDKAIEVYRKLSLLNPAKSAYFADRINVLKHP